MLNVPASLAHDNSQTEPVQIPLPGMPGGVQLAWGMKALQNSRRKVNRPSSDVAQGAFPGFGVMPGACWRRFTKGKTGLEDLPAPFLELRRPQTRETVNRGGREETQWTLEDQMVRHEIRARCASIDNTLRWKKGTAIPAWFVGLVPKRARPFMAEVWNCYVRGTFGLADTQPAIAAKLGCCPRTVREQRDLLVELGLLSYVQLWREKDTEAGKVTWLDVGLYRPGPLLESFAGLAAFAFVDRSELGRWHAFASFPGESRDLKVSRQDATERSAALMEAAKRFHAHQRNEHYTAASSRRARPTLACSPQLFGVFLADVLRERAEKKLRAALVKRGTSTPPMVAPPVAIAPEPDPAELDRLDRELAADCSPSGTTALACTHVLHADGSIDHADRHGQLSQPRNTAPSPFASMLPPGHFEAAPELQPLGDAAELVETKPPALVDGVGSAAGEGSGPPQLGPELPAELDQGDGLDPHDATGAGWGAVDFAALYLASASLEALGRAPEQPRRRNQRLGLAPLPKWVQLTRQLVRPARRVRGLGWPGWSARFAGYARGAGKPDALQGREAKTPVLASTPHAARRGILPRARGRGSATERSG